MVTDPLAGEQWSIIIAEHRADLVKNKLLPHDLDGLPKDIGLLALQAAAVQYVRCCSDGRQAIPKRPTPPPWAGTVIETMEQCLFGIRHQFTIHDLNGMRHTVALLSEDGGSLEAVTICLAPTSAQFFWGVYNLGALAQNEVAVDQSAEVRAWLYAQRPGKWPAYDPDVKKQALKACGAVNPKMIGHQSDLLLPSRVVLTMETLWSHMRAGKDLTEALEAFHVAVSWAANVDDLRRAVASCDALRTIVKSRSYVDNLFDGIMVTFYAVDVVMCVYRVIPTAKRKNGARYFGSLTPLRLPDGLKTLKKFRHDIAHNNSPGAPLSLITDQIPLHDLDGQLPWVGAGNSDSDSVRNAFFEELQKLLHTAETRSGEALTNIEQFVDFDSLRVAPRGYTVDGNDFDIEQLVSKSRPEPTKFNRSEAVCSEDTISEGDDECDLFE